MQYFKALKDRFSHFYASVDQPFILPSKTLALGKLQRNGPTNLLPWHHKLVNNVENLMEMC